MMKSLCSFRLCGFPPNPTFHPSLIPPSLCVILSVSRLTSPLPSIVSVLPSLPHPLRHSSFLHRVIHSSHCVSFIFLSFSYVILHFFRLRLPLVFPMSSLRHFYLLLFIFPSSSLCLPFVIFVLFPSSSVRLTFIFSSSFLPSILHR